MVYSEPSRGTLFHIYLPRFEKEISDSPVKENIKLSQKTDESLSGKYVLVVDDEEVIRDIAKEILEGQRMIVALAKSGEEALTFYKAHITEIDLVMLDIVMPIMNGVRVFHKLKKINPDIKVIFFSGYAESDKITKLKEIEEAVQFIQKPFNMADFISLIHQVLKK